MLEDSNGICSVFLDSDSRVLCLPSEFGVGDSCPSPATCDFETQEAQIEVEEVGSCILGGSLQDMDWLEIGIDDCTAVNRSSLAVRQDDGCVAVVRRQYSCKVKGLAPHTAQRGRISN